MIYGISDIPKTVKELLLYAFQQMCAVFVATTLISTICGTPISSGLFAAFVGTLVYQACTGFKSPMFISNCGATCSAVIGALAIGETDNYLAVLVGGVVIFIIYAIVALICKYKGIESINKVFPPVIVGAVTIVIGLNLAAFIPTYTAFSGNHDDIYILIAVMTVIIIALISHYSNGILKTLPFLVALIIGYIVCVILTVVGVRPLVDFSVFSGISIIALPDFAFLKLFNNTLSFSEVIQVAVMFSPVAICALLEHYSDHKVLSNIIGTDLTVTPGLHRTLLGDGLASLCGTFVGGLPNTSYGESIATTGFSRVCSVIVITVAAAMLGIMSFIVPIQAFVQSVPSCVFGGCAMVLYGFISCSGLKTIMRAKTDLENNKNLIIVSVILTVGVSGIYLFHTSFAGVALAMVVGVILNLILKEKN